MPTDGIGVAGMVPGIAGLVLFWVPAVGLLLAGLVCGIVGVLPGLLMLIAVASDA